MRFSVGKSVMVEAASKCYLYPFGYAGCRCRMPNGKWVAGASGHTPIRMPGSIGVEWDIIHGQGVYECSRYTEERCFVL